MAPSFDPQTGLFRERATIFSIYYNTVTSKAEDGSGRVTESCGPPDAARHRLSHRKNCGITNWQRTPANPDHGGASAFTADKWKILALDPATGKALWHLNIGGALLASPMTYQLDGRQYLIVPVMDLLYAFALPEAVDAAKDR
jgi:alcohol dehydrogenase (cytochrome c)